MNNPPDTAVGHSPPHWHWLPNALTASRMVLALAMFVAMEWERWSAALALLLLAIITDWLDGHAARVLGVTSAFGRVFDPMADKVMVCGAFVFLLPRPEAGVPAWIVAAIVLREVLVTALRGQMEAMGVPFGADRLGKLKMTLQSASLLWMLALLAPELAMGATLGEVAIVTRDVLLHAAAAITLLSGANYLWRAAPLMFRTIA